LKWKRGCYELINGRRGESMSEKKVAGEKIEDTMACAAFAEAGEACPIGVGKESGGVDKGAEKKNSLEESVENTLACAAFAEAGEPCPIETGKKKK
jgi:hypothetical protein